MTLRSEMNRAEWYAKRIILWLFWQILRLWYESQFKCKFLNFIFTEKNIKMVMMWFCMFPYIRRVWFVGQGISVTPQCFIYNGMLWHTLPLSKNSISINCSALCINSAHVTLLWMGLWSFRSYHTIFISKFAQLSWNYNYSNYVQCFLSIWKRFKVRSWSWKQQFYANIDEESLKYCWHRSCDIT